MIDEEYFKRLDKFQTRLKTLDDKLYYEFLHLYDDYLQRLNIDVKQVKEANNINKLNFLKSDLKFEKWSYNYDEKDLEFHTKLEKLRSDYGKKFDEIEKKSMEVALEYSKKEFERLDRITKLLYARPRFTGFMLMILGNKQIRFVDNIDLTKYSTSHNSKSESINE